MTESERKRIPDLYSKEADGMTTMLFSSESGNVKGPKKGHRSGQVQPSTCWKCH